MNGLSKSKYNFRGVIAASKSLMNRALICQSFAPRLSLHGQSLCDDVVRMQQSLSRGFSGELDCGAAGTTFRFLALRVSREVGSFTLRGSERLLSRPQADLRETLERLGSRVSEFKDHWRIESPGWQNLEQPVKVRRDTSSQFASALVLNSWNLPQDLVIEMNGTEVSGGYFTMTLKVVEDLGMTCRREGGRLRIPAGSKILAHDYTVESDVSSLFAVAAFAALNGEAHFECFPTSVAQPDIVFVDILRRMGVGVEMANGTLSVRQSSERLKGVEVNLSSCPDLFPVLALLCAFADSPSRLFGAAQLVHKESNRIGKIAELLRHIGVRHVAREDGMEIFPDREALERTRLTHAAFTFDTDHDHRLAFAAALLLGQDFKVRIEGPEVVSKSFPEFWHVVNLNPDSDHKEVTR